MEPNTVPKNKKQQPKQGEEQEIIKEEDVWIYESIINYIQSPVYKSPIYEFLDQNCVYFENTKEITEEHKTIHGSYQDIVNNMVYILSSDMQVEQRKINELIETGLNIQQHTRAFWTFRICYHFKDFVKYMIKKNLELEKRALQQLQQSQQIPQQNVGGNQQLSEQELQQQLLIQQQIQQNYQDSEYEKAIKDSLALENLRKQRQQDQGNQDSELEAILALSKLEHDERQKERQQSNNEDQELKKIMQLSKQEYEQNHEKEQQQQQEAYQLYQKKPEQVYQDQPQQQVQQQEQQVQQQLNDMNLNEGNNNNENNNLINMDDDDDDLLSFGGEGDGEQNMDFDDQIELDRQTLMEDLNKIASSQQMQQNQEIQQEQQQQQQQPLIQQEEETIEQKKERLKKQRELLLERTKKIRDQKAQDYQAQQNQ